MRRKIADVNKVLDRIEKTVHPESLADSLEDKVETYSKTHNNSDDLTNQEAGFIYRNIDLDKEEQLSKKRKLDLEWSNHAKYRTELRDINPTKVDETIVDRMHDVLVDQNKKKINTQKFKEPGVGTMVVDYNMEQNPADAKVVTVYAKRRMTLEKYAKSMDRLVMAHTVAFNSNRPILAIDFDNTLFNSKGLPFPQVGKPMPGAAEAVAELAKTYRIRVYTCRVNGMNAFQAYDQCKLISDAMHEAGIYFDDIVPWNEGKPFADRYIDDLAIAYKGDWEDVKNQILSKPTRIAGTWSTPESDADVRKLSLYVKNWGENTLDQEKFPADVIYHLLGDDTLFDELDKLRHEFFKDSAKAIAKRVKELAEAKPESFRNPKAQAYIIKVNEQLKK